MKLIASLIVRNEFDRYLQPCVRSLLEFCDEVRILDDFSTDDSYAWLLEQEDVMVLSNPNSAFFVHEGDARNALLHWTLQGSPTHVLAIDADEFIANGNALRAAIDHDDLQHVWTVKMQEIWKADENALYVRSDGGWRSHEAPILWKVPSAPMLERPEWRISDKALSCGREPQAVRDQWRNAQITGTEILHFGWTNQAEREARYQRYMEHDGGKFHSSRHLRSIMFPDRRVRMNQRDWPIGLMSYKAELLAKVAA